MVALWELILLYITQPKAATFLSSTEFHLTAYKSAPRCFRNGRIMQTTAKQEAKHWSVLGGNCTAWGRHKLSYVRNVAGWVTERQQGNNLGVIRQSGGKLGQGLTAGDWPWSEEGHGCTTCSPLPRSARLCRPWWSAAIQWCLQVLPSQIHKLQQGRHKKTNYEKWKAIRCIHMEDAYRWMNNTHREEVWGLLCL